jgi:transcriptional regulator with XRE-family HTH domain
MPLVETVQPDGAAIRRLRTRQGFTSNQLGERIHRSGSAIRNLELGTHKASVILLGQIARALNVDPAEITKDPADSDDDADGEVAA